LRGRVGVVGAVEFEKPVVKVKVEVAEVRDWDKLAGWTLDVYWPGSKR
jgi:hypothetical protein